MGFLLKEDNGFLLLETGDKIILEQSTGGVGWVIKPTYYWDGTTWQPVDVSG